MERGDFASVTRVATRTGKSNPSSGGRGRNAIYERGLRTVEGIRTYTRSVAFSSEGNYQNESRKSFPDVPAQTRAPLRFSYTQIATRKCAKTRRFYLKQFNCRTHFATVSTEIRFTVINPSLGTSSHLRFGRAKSSRAKVTRARIKQTASR